MAAAKPKPKAGGAKGAKGSGLKRKVMGLPLWVWVAAGAAGLMIGIYLRRQGGGAPAAATPTDTGNGLDASAGASPSDNGLGSSSVDLQGFLDAEASQLQDFLGGMQGGGGGFVDGGGDGGGDSGGDGGGGSEDGNTGGVTLGTGNTGNLDLSKLTPATIKAAWAAYNAANKKMGMGTQTTVQPVSKKGTTVKVPGGAFTQVSGNKVTHAVGKVKAIFVPAHKLKSGKTEAAHWALPSGSWVKGPGLY